MVGETLEVKMLPTVSPFWVACIFFGTLKKEKEK